MLIVAPSGRTKLATRGEIFARFSTQSIVTGSVALLLAVENAVVNAGETLPKKRTGFTPPMNFSINGSVINAWTASPKRTVNTYLPRFAKIEKPVSATTVAINANTPTGVNMITTFAIFIGGIIKWIADGYIEKRKLNKEKAANTGILLASGLIAGQAIMGITTAGLKGANINLPQFLHVPWLAPWLALGVFAALGFILIYFPYKKMITSGEYRDPEIGSEE